MSLDKATAKALVRQDYEKQMRGAAAGGTSFGSGGLWSKAEWDQFHAQFGRWPFGMQPDGSFIPPPTYAGCPDWAYQIMHPSSHGKRPPIDVHPGADLTSR